MHFNGETVVAIGARPLPCTEFFIKSDSSDSLIPAEWSPLEPHASSSSASLIPSDLLLRQYQLSVAALLSSVPSAMNDCARFGFGFQDIEELDPFPTNLALRHYKHQQQQQQQAFNLLAPSSLIYGSPLASKVIPSMAVQADNRTINGHLPKIKLGISSSEVTTNADFNSSHTSRRSSSQLRQTLPNKMISNERSRQRRQPSPDRSENSRKYALDQSDTAIVSGLTSSSTVNRINHKSMDGSRSKYIIPSNRCRSEADKLSPRIRDFSDLASNRLIGFDKPRLNRSSESDGHDGSAVSGQLPACGLQCVEAGNDVEYRETAQHYVDVDFMSYRLSQQLVNHTASIMAAVSDRITSVTKPQTCAIGDILPTVDRGAISAAQILLPQPIEPKPLAIAGTTGLAFAPVVCPGMLQSGVFPVGLEHIREVDNANRLVSALTSGIATPSSRDYNLYDGCSNCRRDTSSMAVNTNDIRPLKQHPVPTSHHHHHLHRRSSPRYHTLQQHTKRQRTTFNSEQTLQLEAEYQRIEYVTKKKRCELARLLGLSETQIKIWFQNRRAKDKRIEKAQLDERIRLVPGFYGVH